MNNTNPENRDPLKQQVMKSLAWLGGLKYSGQIITWCITIYVIRLLNPSDYGLMAMAQVCIGFLTMVSELGFGAAIVQRKKIDEHELKNIFGFVLLTNTGLAIVLLAVSPFLAEYFSEPRLVPIFKVLSVNFILLSLYLIPQAILLRNMDFRSKSIVDLIVALFSATTVLILALYGYGVWALVWGAITIHLVSVFGYNIFSHTLILPNFSFKGMKKFFYFSDSSLEFVEIKNAKAKFIYYLAISAVILTIVTFTGYLLISSLTSSSKSHAFLMHENDMLKQELTKVASRFENLRSGIDSLVFVNDQLRVSANLEPIQPEMRLVGVGGNDLDYSTRFSISSGNHNLIRIKNRIDIILT